LSAHTLLKDFPSHERVDIEDIIVIIVDNNVYMGQTAGDFSDLVRVCTHQAVFHQRHERASFISVMKNCTHQAVFHQRDERA